MARYIALNGVLEASHLREPELSEFDLDGFFDAFSYLVECMGLDFNGHASLKEGEDDDEE